MIHYHFLTVIDHVLCWVPYWVSYIYYLYSIFTVCIVLMIDNQVFTVSVAFPSFLKFQVSLWNNFPSYIPSPHQKNPPFKIGLLAIRSLGFLSSDNVFISPSFLKDIFSGYRILGWQFFSFCTFQCCSTASGLNGLIRNPQSFKFLFPFLIIADNSIDHFLLILYWQSIPIRLWFWGDPQNKSRGFQQQESLRVWFLSRWAHDCKLHSRDGLKGARSSG